MVIRYKWYVIESRSFKQAQMVQITHYAYTYNLIGIMHTINGLVLIRIIFYSFN